MTIAFWPRKHETVKRLTLTDKLREIIALKEEEIVTEERARPAKLDEWREQVRAQTEEMIARVYRGEGFAWMTPPPPPALDSEWHRSRRQAYKAALELLERLGEETISPETRHAISDATGVYMFYD